MCLGIHSTEKPKQAWLWAQTARETVLSSLGRRGLTAPGCHKEPAAVYAGGKSSCNLESLHRWKERGYPVGQTGVEMALDIPSLSAPFLTSAATHPPLWNLIFIEVWLIYNVVLISAAICTYTFFFIFFSTMVYHRILNRVPSAAQ